MLGYLSSSRLKEREKTLHMLHGFISELRDGMRYTNAPIERIVKNLLQNGDCDSAVTEAFVKEKSFIKGFDTLLNLLQNQQRITPKDRAMLQGFGGKTGKTDLEGQLIHCDFYQSRIQTQLKEAESMSQKYAKLYLSAGVLSGLGAAVLVL